MKIISEHKKVCFKISKVLLLSFSLVAFFTQPAQAYDTIGPKLDTRSELNELRVTLEALSERLQSGTVTTSETAAELSLIKSTAKKKSSNKGDSGLFSIKFSFTAGDHDAYIDKNLSSPILGTGVHEYSLKSNAKVIDGHFVVTKGTTKTFTLSDKITPSVSEKYHLEMYQFNYRESSPAGKRAVATIASDDYGKFKTKQLKLKAPEEKIFVTNKNNPVAVLTTNFGDIEIELFKDTMPVTTGNFLSLIEKDFYNKTKFHRVIGGFMIQGGDPLTKMSEKSKWGTGNPGYAITDEHIKGKYLSNTRGSVAMANAGPNSGGSQFFINLVDNVGLDWDKPPMTSSHPVFGRVIKGLGVVDTIGNVETDSKDIPLKDLIVEKIEIK